MFGTLLTSRRFLPLFLCQFFSSFNDNFVRNMLALTILFKLGTEAAGPLVTLAVSVFVLPAVFLSGLGGEYADSHDKSWVARRLKVAEIGVQMVAATGFWFGSIPILYCALFGLGVISALFAPIKYGILPDHLEKGELPAGNALIEGGTFLAILLGLIAGGQAAASSREPAGIVLQLMVVAFTCLATCLYIPATRIAAPGLKVDANILRSTLTPVLDIKRSLNIWVCGLAVSWFWLTGAVALSLIPVMVRERMEAGINVETAISAFFAIGIGFGSVAAGIMARGKINLAPVPIAAIGMAIFLLDLGIGNFGPAPHLGLGDVGLASFLTSFHGARTMFDVVGLAASGGMFVVPAFAAAQGFAGEDRRARTVAGVNIVTALFMVGGSLVTALLQTKLFNLSEPVLLTFLGVLNGLAAMYFYVRFKKIA